MKTAIALKKYRFPGYPDEQTFFAAKAAAAICREGFREFVIRAVLERTNAINQQYESAKGNQDPLEPAINMSKMDAYILQLEMFLEFQVAYLEDISRLMLR